VVAVVIRATSATAAIVVGAPSPQVVVRAAGRRGAPMRRPVVLGLVGAPPAIRRPVVLRRVGAAPAVGRGRSPGAVVGAGGGPAGHGVVGRRGARRRAVRRLESGDVAPVEVPEDANSGSAAWPAVCAAP
jgi:hypothetical protein